MVLLTEFRAKEDSVNWMGDDKERITLFHTRKVEEMGRGKTAEVVREQGRGGSVGGRLKRNESLVDDSFRYTI